MSMENRHRVCSDCGVVHDRDVNAAINIRNQNTVGATGINACGDYVSLDPLLEDQAESLKQEAPTL